MKKVLIMMAPAYGHIYPTFPLANELAKEYRVLYAMDDSEIASEIKKNSFEVVNMTTQIFYSKNPLTIGNENWLESIVEDLIDRITNTSFAHTKSLVFHINENINMIKPDVILLDSFISHLYWVISRSKETPILLIQTMLSPYKIKGIPPLNTMLTPTGSIYNNLKIWFAWKYYFLKRSFLGAAKVNSRRWKIIFAISEYSKSTIQSSLDWNRVFQPRILGVKELFLAPRSLEWLNSADNEHEYLGCQGLPRIEETIEGEGVWSKMLGIIKEENDMQWIYCSLGTINLAHNSNTCLFLQKIVDVFKLQSNWRLIISTGMIDVRQLTNVPSNVFVFKKVPQILIMKHCDLVITHGGLNTVLECIRLGLPMLVYPLNEKWDQSGNAARVSYFGLGILGQLKKENTSTITRKIQKIIDEDFYKENVKHWQRKIKSEINTEAIKNIVENAITINARGT